MPTMRYRTPAILARRLGDDVIAGSGFAWLLEMPVLTVSCRTAMCPSSLTPGAVDLILCTVRTARRAPGDAEGGSLRAGRCGRQAGCRLCRSVWSGDDVGDHSENTEVKDPEQEQHDEPHLAVELRNVEQSSDPRDETGDRASCHRECADDPDSEERPRESAPSEPDDLLTVHDEHVVGVGDPSGHKDHDAAGDRGEHAAEKDLGHCCFGHLSFLSTNEELLLRRPERSINCR